MNRPLDVHIFWKLLKGERITSQMSYFVVDNKMSTDQNQTREVWAGYFEELGTFSENTQFDSDFLTHETANVQEIFTFCTDYPSGVLNGLLL